MFKSGKSQSEFLIKTVVALLIGFGLQIQVTNAEATSLLSNTFTSMSNPWAQNIWTVGGDNSSDPNYSGILAHMVSDSPGSTSGRLQLTDTYTLTSRGYALNNQALPTSGGIDIYFNAALFGTGGSAQADGLVFYLKSGSNLETGTASLGVAGGSMGYSSTDVGGSGLSAALLGIGFDAYGNFYQKPFTSATGCSSNEDSHNVPISEVSTAAGYKSKKHLVIRGAMGATRTSGYCRIATSNDEIADYTGSNGGGSNTRNVGVSLKTGVAANIFSQNGAAIRIKIDPQDTSGGRVNGTGNVYVATADTTDWSSVTTLTTFELPSALATSDSFKFGFVAGTGGGSINTQIWGLNIQSLRDISACSPTTQTMGSNTLVTFYDTSTVCSFSFPAGVDSATALIVGGGGGGGGDTAGGGGGGAVETQSVTSFSDPWLVNVGRGGAGGTGASTGATGWSSSLSNGTVSYLAAGGSGGHPCAYNSSYCPDGAGGTGGVNSSSISSGRGGTGGYNGSSKVGPTAGGNGIPNSITGILQNYGAGGGGGQGGDCKSGDTSTAVTGGGAGYICTPSTLPTAGQDRLGAGGGGGGTNGAKGGSGIIYILYVTPVPHTVIFNGNGNTSGSMSNQTSTSRVALTANSFAKDGFNFNGWNTLANGNGTSYLNTATYSFSSDVTLYAQWLVITSGGGGSGVGGYSPPAIVAPILPGITWNPAPLKAGEPLTENQLNAKFSVPGKITYSIPLGTIMKSGIYTVKVTFVPTDTERYLVEETTQQIVVLVGDNSQSISPDGKNSSGAAAVNLANPKSIDTKSLTQLGKIYFNNNEFFLDAGDRSRLKEIAASVIENKYKSVLVFGNTDIKKGVDNTWLSRSRAQAVAKYLKQLNLNVRYTQAWFGPTRPVSKGKDPLSLKLNRRVEIYLIK